MPHYFDPNPELDHKPGEMQVRLHGLDFNFVTDSGVFSRSRLDYGTNLLIEAVLADQKKMTGRLLDLGCGYGPVGIIMKRVFPALEVVLCDINSRALELARKNARLNQIHYMEILQSDGLQNVTGPFDTIMTNPPIRAGKAVVFRFFSEAAEQLKPDGQLYVVIQKKQGAPSALKKLQELFQQVEVIEHAAGYWVIRAKNRVGSAAAVDMVE